jgi:hypothetical protein
MTRTPTFPIRSTAFAALLLAALLAGCASADLNRKNEKLDKSLSIFNKQFESKMTDNVLPMIHKDAREKFALDSLEFRERVTFFETTLIDFRYYKDDKDAELTADGPEEGFNRAVAKIRYRFVTLPSNQVRTAIVEQEWLYEGEDWFVKPKVAPFLK